MANHYPSLNPDKALLWRIVHRDNLPWILDNGLHCGNGGMQAPCINGDPVPSGGERDACRPAHALNVRAFTPSPPGPPTGG